MAHLLTKVLILLSLGLFSGGFVYGQTNSESIIGKWVTGSGKAHVNIVKDGEKYKGTIVWLKEPTYTDGTQKVDKKNPDETKRTRPLMGLALLSDFEWDDDEWDDGEIYDAESGKTYSCTITMPDNESLNVRGYVGISLLGRTDIWKRVK